MKKRVIPVLLTLMLALVLCACGGDTLTTAIVVTGQDTPQEQTTDTNAPEQEATAQGREEEDVPQEWKNALKSAENYSNFMYMSKQGIYDQLTSEYGDNFPAEAAQYAVENLTADYKANALEKAKTYYFDMAMSKQAVYDQLVSEFGEKFTAEEADYAIANLE